MKTILLLINLYHSEFLEDATKNGVSLNPITLQTEIISLDSALARITPSIQLLEIDSSITTYQLKGLIYHELGHLYLNKKDCKGNNLMNPNTLGITERKIKQLFQCSSQIKK